MKNQMLSAEAKNYDEEILQAKLNALILLERVRLSCWGWLKTVNSKNS
jgi:hypothetical protein